jgi:hypothetical protein
MNVLRTVSFFVLGLAATAAGQSQPPAQKQPLIADGLSLTAKSANVRESGAPIRISLLRWSTDEERSSIVASMDPKAPPRTRRGGGSRGALDPNDPALADVAGSPIAGRGGRSVRGAAPAPPNPIASLTAALSDAPTLGYIWTNEVIGYSIKYAYHAPLGAGERIILAVDRPLGANSPAWTLDAGVSLQNTDYDFTIIEIRLNSQGWGEAKTTLTTKVIIDSDSKTISLDDYERSPAILAEVRR